MRKKSSEKIIINMAANILLTKLLIFIIFYTNFQGTCAQERIHDDFDEGVHPDDYHNDGDPYLDDQLNYDQYPDDYSQYAQPKQKTVKRLHQLNKKQTNKGKTKSQVEEMRQQKLFERQEEIRMEQERRYEQEQIHLRQKEIQDRKKRLRDEEEERKLYEHLQKKQIQQTDIREQQQNYNAANQDQNMGKEHKEQIHIQAQNQQRLQEENRRVKAEEQEKQLSAKDQQTQDQESDQSVKQGENLKENRENMMTEEQTRRHEKDKMIRKENEKRAMEEKQRLQEEHKRKEKQKMMYEEKKRNEEQKKKIVEEKRKKELERRRVQEEQRRVLEERRRVQEKQRRIQEEQKTAQEEEKNKEEEERREQDTKRRLQEEQIRKEDIKHEGEDSKKNAVDIHAVEQKKIEENEHVPKKDVTKVQNEEILKQQKVQEEMLQSHQEKQSNLVNQRETKENEKDKHNVFLENTNEKEVQEKEEIQGNEIDRLKKQEEPDNNNEGNVMINSKESARVHKSNDVFSHEGRETTGIQRKDKEDSNNEEDETRKKATPARPQITLKVLFDPDPKINAIYQSERFQEIRKKQISDYIATHFQDRVIEDDMGPLIDDLITRSLQTELKAADSSLYQMLSIRKSREVEKENLNGSLENERTKDINVNAAEEDEKLASTKAPKKKFSIKNAVKGLFLHKHNHRHEEEKRNTGDIVPQQAEDTATKQVEVVVNKQVEVVANKQVEDAATKQVDDDAAKQVEDGATKQVGDAATKQVEDVANKREEDSKVIDNDEYQSGSPASVELKMTNESNRNADDSLHVKRIDVVVDVENNIDQHSDDTKVDQSENEIYEKPTFPFTDSKSSLTDDTAEVKEIGVNTIVETKESLKDEGTAINGKSEVLVDTKDDDSEKESPDDSGGFFGGLFNYFGVSDSDTPVNDDSDTVDSEVELKKNTVALKSKQEEMQSSEDSISKSTKDDDVDLSDENMSSSTEKSDQNNMDEDQKVASHSNDAKINESDKITEAEIELKETPPQSELVIDVETSVETPTIKEFTKEEPQFVSHTDSMLQNRKAKRTVQEDAYKREDEFEPSESVDMDHEKSKYTSQDQRHEHSTDALESLCVKHPTLEACKTSAEHTEDVGESTSQSSVSSYIKHLTRFINGCLYAAFAYTVGAIKLFVRTLLQYTISMGLSLAGKMELSEDILEQFDLIGLEKFAFFTTMIVNHVLFCWYFTNSTTEPVVCIPDRSKPGNNSEMVQLKDEVAELETKLKEKDKTHNDVLDQVKEKSAKHKQLQKEINSTNSQLIEQKQSCKKMETSNKKLSEKVTSLEKSIVTKDGDLVAKVSLIDTLKDDVKTAREDFKQLEDKFYYVIKELDVKDAAISKSEENIETLNNTLNEKDGIIEQKDEELEHVKASVDELTEKMTEANSLLQEERSNVHKLKSELRVVQETLITMTTPVTEETDENSQNDSEDVKAEKLCKLMEATKLQAELQRLSETYNESERNLSDLQGKASETQNKYDELLARSESLTSQNNDLSKSVEKKEIELTTIGRFFADREGEYRSSLASQIDEIKTLKKSLNAVGENDKQINVFIKQIEDLKQEILDNEKQYKVQMASSEEQSHNNYIKMRAAVRECDEHKREKEIYRKRLLDIDMSPQYKKSSQPTERASSPANSSKSTDDNESPLHSAPGSVNYPPSRMYAGLPPPHFPPRPPHPFGMPPRPFPGPMGYMRPSMPPPMPPMVGDTPQGPPQTMQRPPLMNPPGPMNNCFRPPPPFNGMHPPGSFPPNQMPPHRANLSQGNIAAMRTPSLNGKTDV